MPNVRQFRFQWFEPEQRYAPLRLIVQRGGRLYLSRALKKRLPADIRFGFDSDHLVMGIADGHGSGSPLPKGSYMPARAISERMTAAGLLLPTGFLFEYHGELGSWVGVAEPRRRRGGGPVFDVERLLVTHKYIIKQAVCRYAKTTPMEERQAIATEEFYMAAAEFDGEGAGLIPYLEQRVQKRLLQENKRYTAIAANEYRSMEAPLSPGNASSFCLHDSLAGRSCGGIDQVEERLESEAFRATLPAREQRLLQLLDEGFPLDQAALALRLGEEEALALGRTILQKRARFDGIVQ